MNATPERPERAARRAVARTLPIDVDAAEHVAARARLAMDERTRRIGAAPNGDAGLDLTSIVTFTVRGERYAFETACVRECLRTPAVTAVPGTPAILRGVLNLRGELLPAFDLAAVLELTSGGADGSGACILVLGAARAELGIVADALGEVASIDVAGLRAAPASLSETVRRYARGVTDDVVVLLDGRVMLEDPRFFVGRAGGRGELAGR